MSCHFKQTTVFCVKLQQQQRLLYAEIQCHWKQTEADALVTSKPKATHMATVDILFALQTS